MNIIKIKYNVTFLCVTIFISTPSLADITGRVVGVTDGDTITVLDITNVQHKVRLAGIDAPEKKQPFGQNPSSHSQAVPTIKPRLFRVTSRTTTSG
jgi:endonuclease YncB( thermonuclease family)